MKRKWMGLVMILVLGVFTAYAEPANNTALLAAQRWAKGMVMPAETMDVFAPIGGQVQAFDIAAGDTADAESLLITIRPLQVFSPASGVIRLVKGEVGDQASGVIQQYGALCYIERTDVMWVRATTSTAYNKPKNRSITLGETLRVYDGDSNDPLDAMGIVVMVDNTGYVVEIPANIFELEDKVRLYRGEGDTYNSKDKVGEGKVERVPLISVSAQGVIACVHVQEGQTVSKGDLLFTMDDATALHNEPEDGTITAPGSGMVTAIYVQDGQQVRQDQLMMTLQSTDALELVVDVDEMDILSVHEGMMMQVRVDALGEEVMITAIVKEISPLGVTVLDTTKYPVTLSIQSIPEGLLPGMHATAYWN